MRAWRSSSVIGRTPAVIGLSFWIASGTGCAKALLARLTAAAPRNVRRFIACGQLTSVPRSASRREIDATPNENQKTADILLSYDYKAAYVSIARTGDDDLAGHQCDRMVICR